MKHEKCKAKKKCFLDIWIYYCGGGHNYSKGSKQSIKGSVDSIKTIVLFMFFRIYAINGSLKILEINYVLTTLFAWMWEMKIENHHIVVLSLLKQVVVCQFIDNLQKRIVYPSNYQHQI